ncbi:MAG: L-rhamnose mutarotase [Candidatus Dormibacteria bacterium]
MGFRSVSVQGKRSIVHRSARAIRDLLTKYHMHNFSIFIHQLDDGKYYLFGYYEYTGTDYKADMAKLSAEPCNQQWLSVTGPMQVPLAGQKSWSVMKEVYHSQ